jgi:ABC-type phosphate/phosphonate transport system substrate-binding protein
MKKEMTCLMAVLLAMILILPVVSNAEQFKITVIQDQKGTALKYKPVADYLATKGIQATLVSAKDYSAATYMFATGEVDAMFSGSGIAGVFIIKDLAVPIIRPVDNDGHSTHWAAVIARKGSPKFNGSTEYFKDKKVVFTGLASSGEFFFRSLPGASQTKATVLKASSPGDAIEVLNNGQADFAIVKNRVWDDVRVKYPNLTMVGEDKGENPDNTLIVSKQVPKVFAAKVSNVLLALKDDVSPEAQAVKKSLKIRGFIATTARDFDHTLELLKKAGATKSFNFL